MFIDVYFFVFKLNEGLFNFSRIFSEQSCAPNAVNKWESDEADYVSSFYLTQMPLIAFFLRGSGEQNSDVWGWG